jgi:hypothetical protein
MMAPSKRRKRRSQRSGIQEAATPHEEFMRKLSADPTFKKAKRSGQAYIIVGAKPQGVKALR